MSQLVEPFAGVLTAVDLAERFGPIPLRRIRTNPPPGLATEEDVVRIDLREDRICELVDGILVEKDVSSLASLIAARIIRLLANFADDRGLGFVLGEQALIRLTIGRVRAPDVSFIKASQVPGGEFPAEPITDLTPALVVEVMSPGNTKREMDQKLVEYFEAGAELVWYVYPDRQRIEVYTRRDDVQALEVGDELRGEPALPGFVVPVAEVFAVTRLREQAKPE